MPLADKPNNESRSVTGLWLAAASVALLIVANILQGETNIAPQLLRLLDILGQLGVVGGGARMLYGFRDVLGAIKTRAR